MPNQQLRQKKKKKWEKTDRRRERKGREEEEEVEEEVEAGRDEARRNELWKLERKSEGGEEEREKPFTAFYLHLSFRQNSSGRNVNREVSTVSVSRCNFPAGCQGAS